MAGPRQPIDLVVMKGKKHLTKAEIKARRDAEVTPATDEITAPAYLTAAQKKQFNKLAEQLQKINIMGETDCDALARYVVAEDLYRAATKDLQAVQKERPKDANAAELMGWAALMEKLDKRQDRYFKQATAAASKLGLSITDRCRLQVPGGEEAPKENKFARFGKVASD